MAIEVYVPSAETDALLLQWWAHMSEAGEIESAFPALATPSAFLSTLQQPSTLFFERDDQGIAVAAWYAPVMAGAMLNVWARPDRRQRRWTATVMETVGIVLDHVPVVLFSTRFPRVTAAARDNGFVILGTVPHLYAGEAAATIGYITKQMYEEHNGIR